LESGGSEVSIGGLGYALPARGTMMRMLRKSSTHLLPLLKSPRKSSKAWAQRLLMMRIDVF